MCWLLFNFNLGSTEIKSNSGLLLKKIFSDASGLFKTFFKIEELSKKMVGSVCQNFKKLFAILFEKAEQRRQGYMSLLLIENALGFFDSVLTEISQSPKLSSSFLRDNAGLEFIFSILNLAQKSKLLPEPPRPAFLANNGFIKLKAKEEETAGKGQVVSVTNKGVFEKELCSGLKLTSDDKSITPSAPKDWAVKPIKVINLFSAPFQQGKKSLKLRFKLQQKMEMRNLKVGFSVYRTDNFLVVGSPSYVKLNGYYEDERGETQKVNFGDLVKIDDTSFASTCCEIYTININQLTGPDCFKAVQDLKEFHELVEFELVVGKPLITILDKLSFNVQRCCTPVNITINFISGEGFSHAQVDLPLSFAGKVETSLYNFIQVFFNSESTYELFDSYLDGLPRAQA